MSSALPQTAPVAPPDGPQLVLRPEDLPDLPDLDALITEDGAPVDNIFTEKQQRLLPDPLYSSWAGPGEGRTFLVLTNVGLFDAPKEPPLVPDCLISFDVSAADNLRARENRSYFRWVFGKAPELVLEIVSDRRGGEDALKQRQYGRMGVLFYVIFDPDNLLEGGVLRAYALERGRYVPTNPAWIEELGLGVTLWTGAFEGARETWLRWCDRTGRVIPTGAERADEERRRADEATELANEATEKARRLAAQLRALGVEPEA